MLAVIILAGGESRRMGYPKALLPLPEEYLFRGPENRNRPARPAAGAASSAPTRTGAGNRRQRGADGSAQVAPEISSRESKTFLCHLIEVTRHPRTRILRVVAGAHAAEIRAAAKLDAEELVINEDWRSGQLSSLKAGIRSLSKDETEGILVCLVDHPLISSDLVAQLIAAFDQAKDRIIIPVYRGRRGHPVIFPSALFEELLSAPEEIGARAVVRAHEGGVVEVPVEEEGVLLNLNDPESLKRISNPR